MDLGKKTDIFLNKFENQNYGSGNYKFHVLQENFIDLNAFLAPVTGSQ